MTITRITENIKSN